MELHMGRTAKRVLMASTAAIAATMLVASPAAAAVNDNFSASTTDGCGVVNFIDYGPGAPGGGDNDDYLVIHDYCDDGHQVMAYAWLLHAYLGNGYNGNNLAGAPVVWDPFKPYGNVQTGDVVGIKVCLVDGAKDPTAARCGEATHVSRDG